jgi:hypothetical protein
MKRILLFPPRITHLLTAHYYRVFKIILMTLVLITAVYTKVYRGLYQEIINDHLGGLLYVFFLSLFISLFFNRLKAYWTVLAAFVFTCLLEFVQYLEIPFLIRLADHKIFAYLFGMSFSQADFYYYAGGAITALVVLLLLNNTKPAAMPMENIDPLAGLTEDREEDSYSAPEDALSEQAGIKTAL